MFTPSVVRVLLGAVLFSFPALASNPHLSERPSLDRFAGCPPTQLDVNGSTSFLELANPVVLPANSNNSVSFDYAVESEPGFDFLEVYRVDSSNVATLLWKESGLKAGRKMLDLPTSGGATKIRFRYVKDGSISAFRDWAGVKNVELASNHGFQQRWDFNVSPGSIPAGWVSGSSSGGGWAIEAGQRAQSAGRPRAQGGVANSSNWMQRTVTFPAATGNLISFDWFVDSVAMSDFLNVFLDGVKVFTASGRNQAGQARIAVATAGAHTVRFEYAKGAAGSAGLDQARVDNVLVSSAGALVELHRFEGRDLEVTPVKVGTHPVEWTSGGTQGGFVIHRALPHVSYAPAQRVSQQLLPHWKPYLEPLVDGRLNKDEYPNPTQAKVRNQSALAAPGDVWLTTSATSRALFVGMRVPAATGALGSDTGTITVRLDADHLKSLSGSSSCGAFGQLPGNEDRKLVITYSVDGSGAATVSTGQTKGNCAGWVALGSDAPWPVSVAVAESLGDVGYLQLELKLVLPGSVFVDGKLGLALSRLNTWGAPLGEQLPYADGATANDLEVQTWETVELNYTPGKPALSDRPLDGCCFPKPSLPGHDW